MLIRLRIQVVDDASFLLDASVALAVVALIVSLVAMGGAAGKFGFWLIVFASLLLQALSARWNSEISVPAFTGTRSA